MTNRERTIVRDAINMAKRSAILRERAMVVSRGTVAATDTGNGDAPESDPRAEDEHGIPCPGATVSVAATVSVPRHCAMCGGAVCLCGLDDYIG